MDTIYTVIAGLVVIFILIFFIYKYSHQSQNKSLILLKKDATIFQQKEEIEKLNAKFENMSIIGRAGANSVFIFDAEANLEWANIGFSRIFGYSLEEYIEKNGKNPLKASQNSEIQSSFQKLFDTKKPVLYEALKETKTGNNIWMQTALTPFLNDDGRINKIVAIDTNITELKKAESEIQEKNKEIIASITYAKRLQNAILPPLELIKKHLPESFIYYQPKDIVAGDFFWMEELDETIFVAVADCTGHGVPGAMVSVVCSNALNRAVKEFHFRETGEILDKVTELVVETFEKSNEEVKDGMDISLFSINKINKEIKWSGANNPLWYIQNNLLINITADKQPIGKYDNRKPFTTHRIDYITETTFYLFTDGYADQFGGSKGKKFKYKQLEEKLLEISTRPMSEQQYLLSKTFFDWKGNMEQVDDICIIGIKI